jgi:hypothetical protein
MKRRETILVIAALYSSLALADDFKTIGGKEYKGATVSRVEADGIVLRTKSGISKVYFVELPKDVQERFHYHAAKANAEQNAAQEQLRKQQEAALRQRQEATATSALKPGVASDSIKTATPGIQTLPQDKTATATDQVHRIGAVCRDGSESGATGRGACSHHGGVKCWKLSDGTCH